MKLIYIVLTLLFLASNLQAAKFKVEPTEIIIKKTTDFDYVYDYAEIISLTDEAVTIFWQKEYLTEVPLNWETSVQCPGEFHFDSHITEFTFELSENSNFDNKFIFHAYPNKSFGYLEAAFHFNEVGFPDEVQTVVFKISIFDAINSIDETHKDDLVRIEGNQINFTDKIAKATIYDLNGNLVAECKSKEYYDLAQLSVGIYFVNLVANDKRVYNHKIIKH
jgi:hypothetical protein